MLIIYQNYLRIEKAKKRRLKKYIYIYIYIGTVTVSQRDERKE